MRVLFFSLIIGLLPYSVFGGPPADGSTPADESPVFARIARAAATVNTISSDFRQEKHSGMLEEVLVSKGRFYYERPKRLRWEVTEPVQMGFIVDGQKAKRWRGEQGRQERFPIHQVPFIKVFADQVFAWITADFKGLRKGYDILILQNDPIELKLMPLSPEEQRHVKYIKITFSAADSHVNRVEIGQDTQDFIRVQFFNTALNEPLRKDLF
jgi:outer membrane lipoprotein-sorting protein